MKKSFGVCYNVVDSYYIDNDTYVVIFEDFVDEDGDKYHLEVEYHFDEKRFTYTNCWEHGTMVANVPEKIRNEIESEIRKYIGLVSGVEIREVKKFRVEFVLEVDPDATVSDVRSYLDGVVVTVTPPPDNEKIRLIQSPCVC